MFNEKMHVAVIGCVTALVLILGLYNPAGARADEADARKIVKAMSDYMASQKTLSFAYDASLEVISVDHQRLALASSGTVTLTRPDKLRATPCWRFCRYRDDF